MKNNNHIQILQRIVSKSDKIMDDIVNLTMRISTQPSLYIQSGEKPLNDKKDYRYLLLEQLRESAAKSSQVE